MLAVFQAEQSTLADDITDFIDENDREDNVNDTEDIDSFISRVEQLRSKDRRIHQKLPSFCISSIEQLQSKYRLIHRKLPSLEDDYKIHYGKEFMKVIVSILKRRLDATITKGS